MTRQRLVMFSMLLLASMLAACGDDNDGTQSNGDGLEGEITVFAAASLTDAFNDIKGDFEAEHTGVTITYNFAGSQGLVTQLTQGARADVFASANHTQMTAAQEGDVIDSEPRVFTRNKLAIVVPADNPANLNAPEDLANPGVKLVVAAPEVPVGQYTLEILDLMSADPEFGDGFRTDVEANFVSLEDNVRQVVSKVALGEADAGVVYLTDITSDIASDVSIIEIPDEFNIIAEYPVARVQEGDTELADAFIAWILSDEGQSALQEYGFAPLQ